MMHFCSFIGLVIVFISMSEWAEGRNGDGVMRAGIKRSRAEHFWLELSNGWNAFSVLHGEKNEEKRKIKYLKANKLMKP